MPTSPPDLNPSKAGDKLAEDLSALVREYIASSGASASFDEFVRELSIVPIKWRGELKGFWGLAIHKKSNGALAVIKAVYIVPKTRGRLLNKFTDILMEGLAERGVTHIEVWAFPKIEKWLRHRYKFTPRIHIIQTPIEGFLTFDRTALREELRKKS